MRQRFGIDLGERRRRLIVQAIQSGRAMFLRRQSQRVSHWRVEVDGVAVVAVYDNRRKEIVTVLPPGAGGSPVPETGGVPGTN